MNEPVVDLLEKLEREAKGEEKQLTIPWPQTNFGLGGGLGVGTLTFLAGQPGAGKSFMATLMCLRAEADGWRWQYMPLEKDRVYALRRFLACYFRRWDILKPESANMTRRLLEDDETAYALMVKTGDCISENPFRGVIDDAGRRVYPPVYFSTVVDDIRRQCERKDFVVVDPMAAIEFDDGSRDQFENQKRFVRELSAIASETKCRIVVVHHVRKANGPQQHTGLDEIAGSSGIGRFTDNALTVEFHKVSQESDVLCSNGFTKSIVHDKTVTLAKCKDGPGTNWRIACDLGKDSLDWLEHGIVKSKVKGR